jgi:teichuronic acid biosynthesis protein TuaE
MNKKEITKKRLNFLEKKIFYLVFLTGFFGAAFFTADLGLFTLFPYRFFLLLLLVIFSLKTLFSGKIIIHQKSIKWYILFLFFWLGYSVISLAWAPSKGDAIRDIIFLFMSVLLIFFFTYYIKNETDLKKVYNIWLAVLGILIIIGFWEHLTGNHLSVSRNYNEIRSWRMFIPTGVFFNPNDYATFLALSIPFGIVVVRYYNKTMFRLFGIVAALLAFYLIVETGSRANIIAVLLEIIFIFLFLMNINQKTKIIFTASILVIFLFLFFGNNIYQYYEKISIEITSIGRQVSLMKGSMGVRINLIKNSLSFLYKTAGFGVGAGNAEYYMANIPQYNTYGILNPHNWWLEILVNYGILVFAGYLLFYFGIIYNLWKISKKNLTQIEKMICEALLVSLVGLFFASISSSSIMAFKPQWLLFAFALSFLNYIRSKEGLNN